MNAETQMTSAELELLLAESPIPGKLSRRELISRLEQAFARLQKETTNLAATIKKEGSESPRLSNLMEEIQELSDRQLKITRRLQWLKNPQTGITSIRIENFKGIGPAVTIPLRPITLLFGANSAGKSTILQALHYARELLERNNANPDRTLTGGEAIEMGGFRNLVHRHDLNKEIRVRLEITPTADGVPTVQEITGEEDLEEEQVRLPAAAFQSLLQEAEKSAAMASDRSREREKLKKVFFEQVLSAWGESSRERHETITKMRQWLKEGLERRWIDTFESLDLCIQFRPWDKLAQYLTRVGEHGAKEGEIRIDPRELRQQLDHCLKESEEIREETRKTRDRVRAITHEFEAASRSFFQEGEQKSEFNRRRLEDSLLKFLEESMAGKLGVPAGTGLEHLRNFLAHSVGASRKLNINPYVETLGIEVVTRWDFEKQEGWFSECQFLLNDRPILTIQKAKPDSRPAIERIEYFHPVLLQMDEALKEEKQQYEEEIAEYMAELHGDLSHHLLRKNGPNELQFDVVQSSTGQILIEKGKRLSKDLLKRIVEAMPDVACLPGTDELFPQARIEIEEAIKHFQERQAQLQKRLEFVPHLQLTSQLSVAPDPGRALPFKPTELGEDRAHFGEVINQIAVGITSLALQGLRQLRYIGPIRAIPERSHEAPQIEDASRWSSGLAAWDLLLRHYSRERLKGDEFVDAVSQWLLGKDHLDLGYSVEVTGLRPIPEDSLLMNQLRLLQSRYDEKNQHEFRQSVWGPLQTLPQTPRIRLLDTRTKTEVGPKDIGIGVAQALPIVVGALDAKGKFIAIEQPELHLHPAAQARLGDLFVTQAKAERLFLIETHSETLMLRIFRRIRETTRGKVPRKELQISKGDVALLFLSSGDKGTSVSEIRLNDQGKFIDPVPGGFFEEGFDELF